MSIIPETLQKYFHAPHTLAEDPPHYYETNKYLLRQLQCGTKQDIVSTRVNGDFRSKFFEANEENCQYAFTYNCWSNLKDDEKARTIFTLIQKTMRDKFSPLTAPNLHFVPSQKYSNQKAQALYHQKKSGKEEDFVFVKPSALVKIDGLTVVSLVTHELQHHYDFNMCDEKLLPHIIANYVDPSTFEWEQKDRIMLLPIAGQIYNYQTQSYEPISPQLQEQILMLKHKIYQISSSSKIIEFSDVKTPNDMLQFMEFHAYTNTPLERRAYATGLECAQQVYDTCVARGIKIEGYDNDDLNAVRDNVANHINSAQTITRITGKPMEYICNLFNERQFLQSRLSVNQHRKAFKSRLQEINAELQELANCFTSESQSSM